MTTLATRTEVTLGSLHIEGFMLPDGSYRMSQTQAAETIGKPPRNAGRFLTSKGIKTLLGKDYTADSIEVNSNTQTRGQARINALPLEVVSAYWLWESFQGNKQALLLTHALMTESLERRFDSAFGMLRPDAEYQQRLELRRLGEQVAELTGDVEKALETADSERYLRETIEARCKDMGVDPWE